VTETPEPPAGFSLSIPAFSGGFSDHNGPYFDGPPDGPLQRAFFALDRHANGLGVVHGGMLSAFTDSLLAHAVGRATGKIGMTINLSTDFLHMARAGEWVIGEASMTRATADFAFAEGRLRVGRRDVVRASGIFKLMQRRR